MGPSVAGIDASDRLIAVAQDRVPGGDVRVGDMHALPWDDHSFDVVTSFRGIWGTTPDALAEARRVLVPGGRLGFTVWGHIKKSPGAWSLSPFQLASQPKVKNQANMVALGRPGAGEELLARYGFEDVSRMTVPFAWEFPDPETYARALASTGPAYEAIQTVGEEEFVRWATEMAREHVRDGLPLRAEIDVVGYLARAPQQSTSTHAVGDWKGAGFLGPAAVTPAARAYVNEDVEDLGYVMNGSRVWAHLPAEVDALFALMGRAKSIASLSMRQRAILVTATASTMGDSYCSLAWGQKLSTAADPDLAASVLAGTDAALTPRRACPGRLGAPGRLGSQRHHGVGSRRPPGRGVRRPADPRDHLVHLAPDRVLDRERRTGRPSGPRAARCRSATGARRGHVGQARRGVGRAGRDR